MVLANQRRHNLIYIDVQKILLIVVKHMSCLGIGHFDFA